MAARRMPATITGSASGNCTRMKRCHEFMPRPRGRLDDARVDGGQAGDDIAHQDDLAVDDQRDHDGTRIEAQEGQQQNHQHQTGDDVEHAQHAQHGGGQPLPAMDQIAQRQGNDDGDEPASRP